MATAVTHPAPAARVQAAAHLRVAGRLSSALVAAALSACALTLLVPGVLRGPAAMNGSAAGTALVVLVLNLPALAVAIYLGLRGSLRAQVVWLGLLAQLLYDGVLFMFATPFNQLFLVYAAMLSLAIWSVIAMLRPLDVASFKEAAGPAFPRRLVAVCLWAVAALNLLAWLRGIVPGVLSTQSPAFLAGTGLTTSPVYVQDLTFWIPLTALSAGWLWTRSPWGYLLSGAFLVFGVIESVSIAVDQWMGASADPASPAVSLAIVPAFAALALLLLVPLYLYMRGLRSPGS